MHCVHTIKSELTELDGVKSVEGDFQTKKIVVAFEPPATEKAIEELLVEINYAPEK
jgi:copper chaperone CopZ